MDGIIIQQDAVYKTEKGTPVTDSLKVAQVFNKEHKNIIRAIRNLMGSAQNCAHRKWFYESSYCDTQGKQRPMFIMTRDGFSLLAMGLTGAKAMQFKIAFIEQFNAMEKVVRQAAQPTTTPAIPQSFAEALRLAAAQAEQIERQQKQIEADAPRVLFSQAVETAKQSVLIGELAKIICQNGVQTGEKRLFAWMRENGYLCQHGERYNQPTQKAMELGLFEIKKTTIQKPNGDTLISNTTKVTGKGQVYFVNKFLQEFAAMRIYISGKISGLPYKEVEAKFNDAEALLTELGFEVINPLKNGLATHEEWIKHLCKDIEMLHSCDAIYMMDNWTTSTGASIEYDIAIRTGKDIWFESNVVRENKEVLRIQNAIHEVTGMRFNQYITKSRKRDGVFARMIFVYHCRKRKMKLIQIAKYVHRDHSSMLHLLKKYDDDFKYNPQFREMATRVNNILNKTNESA